MSKYYSLNKILKCKALYNIIYGQRSNGKTFSVIRLMLDRYLQDGTPSAYIRRLDSEMQKSDLDRLVSPHNEYIEQKTAGAYNRIIYRSKKFYLAFYDIEQDKITVIDENPCIMCFSLNLSAKSKGADRGKIAYTLFDEFLTRQFYLANEFVTYCELLSTLMRDRDGTIHFLVGNTVNQYCPYFAEMGITNIAKQKQGSIDVYTYGNSGLSVAVEYCSQSQNTKPIQKYFAFDNPQLNMIFTGSWEIANYPHAPEKIKHSDSVYKAFIRFDTATLCVNVIDSKHGVYLFITPWTTDVPDDSICYVQGAAFTPYQISQPNRANTKIGILIYKLMCERRVFFSDNATGEIYNNWIKYHVNHKYYI